MLSKYRRLITLLASKSSINAMDGAKALSNSCGISTYEVGFYLGKEAAMSEAAGIVEGFLCRDPAKDKIELGLTPDEFQLVKKMLLGLTVVKKTDHLVLTAGTKLEIKKIVSKMIRQQT